MFEQIKVTGLIAFFFCFTTSLIIAGISRLFSVFAVMQKKKFGE
jgi:hypothetical protein